MKKQVKYRLNGVSGKVANPLIIALTFHIFSVHSKLLYYLNPELDEKLPFSFLRVDEPTFLALGFALAYSLGTITVLRRSKKWSLVYLYAVLDSIGVLLYYFTEIPLQAGAIYFALYTGTLIISTMYLNKPEYMADQIREMKEKGISQREIAQELNISESKVSRVVNRTKAREKASIGS